MIRFPRSPDADDSDVVPLRPDGLPLDPTLLMFVIQLAVNNGNASSAARAVGLSPTRGRMLCKEHPELRNIAKQAIGLGVNDTIRRWSDMHSKALTTINELIDGAEDDRVKLAAAQTVIERVEGKAPQKGAGPLPTDASVMEDVTVRFAASYYLSTGTTLADAMQYAEKNPEVVEAWAKRHGLIAA